MGIWIGLNLRGVLSIALYSESCKTQSMRKGCVACTSAQRQHTHTYTHINSSCNKRKSGSFTLCIPSTSIRGPGTAVSLFQPPKTSARERDSMDFTAAFKWPCERREPQPVRRTPISAPVRHRAPGRIGGATTISAHPAALRQTDRQCVCINTEKTTTRSCRRLVFFQRHSSREGRGEQDLPLRNRPLFGSMRGSTSSQKRSKGVASSPTCVTHQRTLPMPYLWRKKILGDLASRIGARSDG